MRLTLKPGESLRLACDTVSNALSVYIGRGFVHVSANEPSEPAKCVIAATETVELTAGTEAREERGA